MANFPRCVILCRTMRVGFWSFSVYTLKVVAGALIAGLWVWQRAPRAGFDRRAMRFWICGVAMTALLGGRVGYILGNATYFAQHPALSLRLDRVGGLHSGSAMIGALLMTGVWAAATHHSVSAIVSFLSPAVLFVTGGAWWGCWDAGCAWGHEALAATDGARWFIALLPDIYQTVALRYAVQPLGAVWALILALLAIALGKHGGVALALYWLGSAGLTLLRSDPTPLIITLTGDNVRLDTILDLALAIGIILLMLMTDPDTRNKTTRALFRPYLLRNQLVGRYSKAKGTHGGRTI